VAWLDNWTPVAITNHVTAPAASPGRPTDARSPHGARARQGTRDRDDAAPPEGAKWAEPARVVDRLVYRFNGPGYLPEGFSHVFVVPADGGTARRSRAATSTTAPSDSEVGVRVDARRPVDPDLANRRLDWDMEPLDSGVWSFSVKDRSAHHVTDRKGPDDAVAVSPDGKKFAWVGFDDRYQGYQVPSLYVRDLAGGEARVLAGDLDRDAGEPAWAPDGKGVYFSYDDHGRTKLALSAVDGTLKTVAEDLGAGTLSYTGSGGFSVARDGTIAFAHAAWNRPGDIAVLRRARANPPF